MKLQKGRSHKKKLLTNRLALEKRIKALRAEADYLERLLAS